MEVEEPRQTIGNGRSYRESELVEYRRFVRLPTVSPPQAAEALLPQSNGGGQTAGDPSDTERSGASGATSGASGGTSRDGGTASGDLTPISTQWSRTPAIGSQRQRAAVGAHRRGDAHPGHGELPGTHAE